MNKKTLEALSDIYDASEFIQKRLGDLSILLTPKIAKKKELKTKKTLKKTNKK